MFTWRKWWLLFTVIWVVVAGLNVATILVFAEEVERGKALTPAFFAVAVPAAAYLLGLAWEWWKGRK